MDDIANDIMSCQLVCLDSAANSLHLTYSADVTNLCGEDWTNADLVLSTSAPAVGASPPTLSRKKVIFKVLFIEFYFKNTLACLIFTLKFSLFAVCMRLHA